MRKLSNLSVKYLVSRCTTRLAFESRNGVERREGDSNPRILADQRFSRPPESTALASLQAFYSRFLTVRD